MPLLTFWLPGFGVDDYRVQTEIINYIKSTLIFTLSSVQIKKGMCMAVYYISITKEGIRCAFVLLLSFSRLYACD